MDENAKKKALLMIPYGLFVLGARQGDKQTVATVNWLTQASFKPPLVVVGIKADSTAHALVKESKIFTLSMLGAGQKSIGTAFFKHVEPKDGKFGNFAFEAGRNGAPIISDAPAALECKVVGFHELGDHSVVIGEVTEGHLKRESEPLTLKECGFNYGGWFAVGEANVASKKVVVLPGDDAAPETVGAAIEVLRALEPDIEYVEFPPGEQWVRGKTAIDARAAIDASDSTLFGSTSGKTAGIFYLRWGKDTYANVRPARYIPGARSPLKHPEGIDFVIVRENLEDLYLGLEGSLEVLSPLKLHSRITRAALDTSMPGKFAIKVITERNSKRIAEFAFKLARKRKALGGKGKVTCTSKYNMLCESDELFRRIAEDISSGYPDIVYEQFIIDDFARRVIQSPHDLDVVVMPNLYGDIMSDAAAGTLGGLGLAPSGCYGGDYAYFESVHGTAPDIVGQNIINPTATMLSAAMMLEYLGFIGESQRFESAVRKVYADGRVLTPDQGGRSSTTEFTRAVLSNL